MSAAVELDTFLAHLNRPGAAPAPTPVPQPKPTTDQPFPSRPLAPCVTDAAGYTAWLDTLSIDELIGEIRRGEAEFEWTTGKSIWPLGEVA